MPPNSDDLPQQPTANGGPARVADKFELARALHQRGQLNSARAACLDLLAMNADHFEALNMMGVLAGQSNDLQLAVQYFDRAIAVEPANSAAYCNRGLALKQLNQHQAALASFDQAIALNAEDAVAHYGRGETFQAIGHIESAVAAYDRALAVNPSFAQAWFYRGVLLQEIRNWNAALASYDRAIDAKVGYAEAHANKAAVLHHLKRFKEAQAGYERAIDLAPNYAAAHLHLGNVLKDLGQLDAALANYDTAVKIQPDYAEAYSNRSIVLYDLGRLEEALDSNAKAILIMPERADLHFNRASILRAVQRFEDATSEFGVTERLDPTIRFLPGAQLEARMQICDWQHFDAEVATIAAAVEQHRPVAHPFAFLSICTSPRLQKKCAETWVREMCPEDDSLGQIGRRTHHGRIRIGYFSADFREHPVSRLLVELIETHDRSRFEVIAFSFGAATQDDLSRRLHAAFDRFIDVQRMSNLEIASLARSLNIDIAVDLGGYTHNTRPNIFSLRAAPIQVSYLGYLGTMGAPYMDYLVADATIIPSQDREHYAERIIYLPSYQANDSRRKIAERTFTRQELGIPDTGFVFSCFNTNYKISPQIFDVWMRILGRVRGSILYLYADNLTARRNLLQEVQRAGIDGRRIVFGGRLGIADYLARYRTMDLFLDTLPYNAGTTASDALWAGLPVLTCMGATFAGRVAASLLKALDLPELVTATLSEYEQAAIELGSDPERLAALKGKLAIHSGSKPLFKQQELTKHLEIAFTHIQERHRAALPPDHILVPDWSASHSA